MKKRLKALTPTVLIDRSGSMGWSPAAMTEFAKAMPYATVAVYSGYPGPNYGDIAVVLQDGRTSSRADSFIRSMPGGNVIDGPALGWLGEQEGPRVWVSDGHVTGKDEHQSQALFDDVAELTKKFDITQTRTLEGAKAFLKRYARESRIKLR